MMKRAIAEPSERGEETEQRERDEVREMDELDERYGRQFEPDHWGEYLAVLPNGETLLGSDLMEVTARALQTFGRGKHSPVFKVGEIDVVGWR